MPDNKKTNAVNFKNMTPAQRKEQMAKWKQERINNNNKKTSGNNKTNKNHRTTVKTTKRNNKQTEATAYWKANPDKKHSMKHGVNPKNPNKKFVEKTAYDGKGFGKDDKISKAFSAVAGTALTGGLSNAAKVKG